ncbi:MAG: ABC transporter permease [Oscillospiraceae bacterium]|nr:ABC transporter permease [Oscillospiraceae bacterium]MCL2277810.1 ABC transporter permease [Oscillospiraceae bacterium]
MTGALNGNIKKVGGVLIMYYRPILLVGIIIASSAVIQDPVQNMINVFTMQAPYVLIYTMGMTLAIVAGGLDLSQGSVAAFSTCFAAMWIIQGGSDIVTGIIICIVVGAMFGMTNGIIITKAKVPPFIATYGMDWAARGLTFIMMGGVMIYGFSDEFLSVAWGTIFGISNIFYIAIALFVILALITLKTTFGRQIYMVGSNPQAAKLSGVRNDAVITAVYTISGALAAIAGLLFVSRLDVAEAFLGRDFALNALAASLIGGSRQGGGKGGVINAIQGVLIMLFIFNLLNVWRVSVLWHPLVFGIIIVVAAVLEQTRTAYMVKRLS